MSRELHEEIRTFVLTAISQGELRPGDSISDQMPARALGVSRTPVRAVLQQLAGQGLVRKVPGRGWQVGGSAPRRVPPPPENQSLIARMLQDRVKGALAAEVFESEMMERYGTSRADVKRALERLAADGLVERRRGHGWRFEEAISSPDALRESYVFREILECGSLEHPDWRDRPATRVALEARHREILGLERAALDPADWFDTNSRFHEYIAGGLENAFVTRALAHQNRLRRLREYAIFGNLRPERIRLSCEEHLSIMAAIAEEDRRFAAVLLRRHLRKAAG